MIFVLSNDSFIFPPPELADNDGFLAVGGDLKVPRLLNAYRNGIFPWYNPGEIIKWWCPRERFVIFPEKAHISRSMKKLIKQGVFDVKMNVDFGSIIHNCRIEREDGTWITDEMETAYKNLYDAGHVICVGVYEKNILVGGLYGVAIGKCFFGESMFSLAANASKLALIYLCKKLAAANFAFIDCQFHTKHLESMGGEYISWGEYRELLGLCESASAYIL